MNSKSGLAGGGGGASVWFVLGITSGSFEVTSGSVGFTSGSGSDGAFVRDLPLAFFAKEN